MNIRLSRGRIEKGVYVGNAYPKYNSKNPLIRWLMKGFEKAVESLVLSVAPATLHEVGCGEGYWVLYWLKRGFDCRGSDFSAQVIHIAKENALTASLDPERFTQKSFEELSQELDRADCLLCLEVLEHLENPSKALQILRSLQCGAYVFSVPREPLWRILNLCRGKYLGQWGNTPGHLQHWSQSSFIKLVSEFFVVEEVLSPLPWTVLKARPRLNI